MDSEALLPYPTHDALTPTPTAVTPHPPPSPWPSHPPSSTYTARPLSSCSARIRIAALLKGNPLTEHTLRRNAAYVRLNPNATVPTLVATYPSGESLTLTQSLSMLEFLEESYQGAVRLLPPATDMAARAQARDLATLVACDVQPVQSTRVRRRVEALGQDGEHWAREVLWRGVRVYEGLAGRSVGRFSVGNEVSIADVCLFPMVQRARRARAYDDSALATEAPAVSRIMQALEGMEAFRVGGLQTSDLPSPRTTVKQF
ncbi:hypothetical protein MMC17_003155 [Xylographa soralifera]|nr:hypothetical protein [Xylographa soralifera]